MTTKAPATFQQLQAGATTQNPKADVAFAEIHGEVTYTSPRVEIQHRNLTAAVSFVEARAIALYVNLSATDIILDPFFIFRPLTDTITPSDSTALAVSAAHTDTLSVTEQPTFNVAKTLADNYFFADAIVIVWTPIRLFLETTTVTDAAALSVSRPLSDSTTMSDALLLTFLCNYSDTVTVSDTVIYDFAKGLSDTFSYTEALVLATGKTLAESVSIGDNMDLISTSIESSVPNVSPIGTYMINH